MMQYLRRWSSDVSSLPPGPFTQCRQKCGLQIQAPEEPNSFCYHILKIKIKWANSVQLRNIHLIEPNVYQKYCFKIIDIKSHFIFNYSYELFGIQGFFKLEHFSNILFSSVYKATMYCSEKLHVWSSCLHNDPAMNFNIILQARLKCVHEEFAA